MKKKLLTMAMAFCLIATMMPIYTGVAFADANGWTGSADDVKILGTGYAPTNSTIKYLKNDRSGGVIAGSASEYNIKIEQGTTTSTYAITLKDATISGTAIGIEVGAAVLTATITLEGTNTITTSDAGIKAFDNMTSAGNAELIITSPNNDKLNVTSTSTGDSLSDIAVCSWRHMTIDGDAELTVNGRGVDSIRVANILSVKGNAVVNCEYGGTVIGISGGTINLSGNAKVNAESDKTTAVSAQGSITISDNATLEAVSKDGNSDAVFANNNGITITGGTVTASAVGGAGLRAVSAFDGGITISGGANVTATGSTGIYADNKDITISGTGTTVTASGSAFGINATTGAISISDGATVEAKSTSDKGINANEDIMITGTATTVTASGIDANQDLTISGSAKVTSHVSGDYATAISGSNSINISGTAQVNAKSEKSTAMLTVGNINISDSAALEAVSEGTGTGDAVFAQKDITINGGTVTASAIGGAGLRAYSGSLIIKGGANVTATGSNGIYAEYKDINISGTGTTVTASGSAFGINATRGAISISGVGTNVTAVGSTSAMNAVPSFGTFTATIKSSATTDGNSTTFEGELTSMNNIKKIEIEITGSQAPSRPSAPTIVTDSNNDGMTDTDGGTVVYEHISRLLAIKPAEGFTIKDVLVNGQSKGAVTALVDVSVYDKVEVIFEKIPEKTPEQIQAEKDAKIKVGVKATTITLSAKASTKGIKLTWNKSKGYKVNKYLVYRSVNGGKYSFYKTTTSTSFTNSKVTEGKVYRFKVKGVRTIGDEKTYTKTSKIVRVRAK